MARAKAKVQKSGGVSVSLSLNALIGILLAIIGAFMVFNRQGLQGTLGTLSYIVAIFLICVGAVSIVHYFRYKQDGAVLIVGIFEILVGVLLLISSINKYFIIIIAAFLILYGAVHLFRYHRSSWDFITGLTFIAVGVLVLITYWVSDVMVFNLIVGISALVGAAYFLFLA